MPEQIITCPKCSEEIPLTDVLTNQITQGVRKEFQEKLMKEKENLKRSLKKDAENEFSLEIKDLSEKLEEKDQKLSELKDAELKARKLERQLTEKDDQFQRNLEDKIRESENKITDKLKNDYEERTKEKIKKLEQEVKKDAETSNQKLIEANENLRNEKKEKQELELLIAQQKDAINTEKIKLEKDYLIKKEELRKSIIEENRAANEQEINRKTAVIDDLKKEINNLRTKAEQGSQQIQGEVSEEQLKNILKTFFPEDLIDDVPVGVSGADIVQKIKNFQGKECGIILWESKNTKTWQNSWIDKLKTDQKKINANFAVLVSKTLPREVQQFGDVRNVWVSNIDLIIPLTKILRGSILELYQKEQSLEGKNLKMERLYSYLNSSAFKQRVHDSLDSFNSMKQELEKEITSTTKRWNKRRLLIERVQENLISMYGTFEGIASHAIPELETIANDLLESKEGE